MQRIWDKINKTDTCWEWTACKGKGYGLVHFEGKLRVAHRVVYQLLVGKIPEGLTLDHLCRNRSCVNPEHLEPVTQKVNTLRSEAITAQLARRSACKYGHSFTPDNTTITYGWRRCKTCNRDRAKIAYYKALST